MHGSDHVCPLHTHPVPDLQEHLLEAQEPVTPQGPEPPAVDLSVEEPEPGQLNAFWVTLEEGHGLLFQCLQRRA